MDQLETLLLEDDPTDLALVKKELEQRGIVVHAFQDGNEALHKLRTDTHIEVFLTDIAIDYPSGYKQRKLQGYDVANIIAREYPERYLGVIVLSSLSAERVSDVYYFGFQCPILPFHKEKWLKLKAEQIKDWNDTFDGLEALVTDIAGQSWSRWGKLVKQVNPKSVWISGQQPYLPIYIGLRRNKDWRALELGIGDQAREIVTMYKNGDHRPLQGGFTTLSEKPNASSFREHLIARRVVYAVKKIAGNYWEQWLQGVDQEQEDRPQMDFWDKIESRELRTTLNRINLLKAELASLEKQRGSSKEFIAGKRERALQLLADLVKKANVAAANEPDTVQVGVAGIVRELETLIEHSHAGAGQIKKSKSKPKPENRLQATLRLLGIEKKHIKDPDPSNWKLLLPEEAIWLKSIRG
jgi:CheY-like chemotaxis protein